MPFPVKVEGKKVNTVQAIWTRYKSEITEEEYNEFYKFIGNAADEPMYRLHFSADAPLAINALLYVPKENFEIMGMGRMQPGVNLYCQKVLIDQHSENILPEWLRFLKGVVDSEDLPLNISRQALQDNALVGKLRKVVTKSFIKFLEEEAERDSRQIPGILEDLRHLPQRRGDLGLRTPKELGQVAPLRILGQRARHADLACRICRPDEGGTGEDLLHQRPEPGGHRVRPLCRDVQETRTSRSSIPWSRSMTLSSAIWASTSGKKLVSADRADLKLPESTERRQ